MSKAAKDKVQIDRYVISAKILGKEKRQNGKNSKEQEFAIDVILSDESQYTVYRSMKDIVTFHKKLTSRFPVEAGHFSDKERVIPECPIKKTPFGFRQVLSDEKSFSKVLNSYIKELPALPQKMIKSDVFQQLFTLLPSDIDVPLQKKIVKEKKYEPVMNGDGGEISSPILLKSYITLADFKSAGSTKFSFKKDTIVQVVQKESKGWWLVDIQGMLGWAPASFLVPVDKDDIENEFEENDALIGTEKVGARYISTSAYQASRDDELSFVKGAVVRVIKKYIDGWWLVRYNGEEGFAPAIKFTKFDKRQATAYVKGIKRNFVKRKSTNVLPTMKTNWQVDKKTHQGEKCKRLALYQCLSTFIGREDKFEISSLNKGDTVKVLEKKHHGWWYVQDQHGRSGWAPATYFQTIYDPSPDHVKGDEIVGSVHSVVHSFLSQREDELTVEEGEKVLVIGVSDDGWWMVRQIDNPLMQGLIPCLCLKKEEEMDELQTSGNGENITSTQEVSNSVGSDNSIGISRESLVQPEELEDCYVVASDYSKKEIDEIDVFEGEIACIIDSSQTDIWYVNVNGKEGWIPSDVLRPLSDDELIDTDNDPLSPYPTVSLPLHPGSEIVPESEVASLPPRPVSEIVSLPPHPIMSTPLSDNKDSDSPIDFDSHSNHHVLNTKQQTPQSSISSEDKTQNSIIIIAIQSEDESLEESFEELERAAAEAERLANEANEKANILRKKAEDIRKRNSMNLSS